MKYLFLLAVLLPMILGAPQERFLIGNLQIHVPDLHKVVEEVEKFAHSGMGQTACVTACGSALSATGFGTALTLLCPTACTQVLKHVK